MAEKDKKPHRKRRNEVSTKIISGLLQNERMTAGEIADWCGYEHKGKDKYSFVRRQLVDLTNKKQYLERTEEGAPRTYYWIKRDIPTLWRLYNDPPFAAIQKDVRVSTWLINLVLQLRINGKLLDEEVREDARKMLSASKLLFELFFNNEIPNDYFGHLDNFLCHPSNLIGEDGCTELSTKTYTFGDRIFDFFIFCMFVEYQRPLMTRFTNVEGLPKWNDRTIHRIKYRDQRKIIQEMSEKSKDIKRGILSQKLSNQTLKPVHYKLVPAITPKDFSPSLKKMNEKDTK